MAQVDKIMSVYYGCDKLPYKDENREVHYPIVSGVNNFIGENNTTKIRFYVDRIGGHETTWVAIIKKSDGSLTYRLLDDIANEEYVELSLTSYYLEYEGALVISLQGYSGGTNVSVDYEDGVYEISGTPTIICTGNIKIMVNYAPIHLNMGSEIQPNEYQLLLARLAQNIEQKNVILRKELTPEDLDNYDLKQLILILNADNSIFKLVRVKQGSGTSHTTEDIFDFVQLNEDMDATAQAITNIINKIPSDASSSNKLADKDWTLQKINEEASYKITKNTQGQNFATFSELENATTFYSGGAVRVPTRNDYAYVKEDETHNGVTTKYTYQGGTFPTGRWEFDIEISETPLTDAQFASLNSGITSNIVNVLKKGQVPYVKVDADTTLADLYALVGNTGSLFLTYLRSGDTYDTLNWDSCIFMLFKDTQTNKYFIHRWTSLWRDYYSTTNGSTKLLNIFESVPPIEKLATRQTFELTDNKITSWGTPTNTQYPSAKLVKDSLDEIRGAVTNLPRTFVADMNEDSSTLIEKFNNGKTIWVWNDYQDEFVQVESDSDIPEDIINYILNTQATSIDLRTEYGYLALEYNGEYWLVYRGSHGYEDQLKNNDNINVVNFGVPDWWYANDTLYAHEFKDLTQTANTFSQKQTFSGGIKTTYLTQDDVHQITPNKIIDSIGTTLKDTIHTGYSGGLNCANQYIFTQPLIALTLSALEYLTNDSYKMWNISFKVASGFIFTMPSGKTYKWAEGEPIWETDTIYTLLIQEGVDTDYIIYVSRA